METYTGTESPPITKKSLYEKHGVAVCSQNKALVVTAAVFITIFAVSIIIAYTGPQSECSCAGEKPLNYQVEDYDSSKPFVPIATNGQVFPWNNVRLPNFVRPWRYNITIRPNLTTLEVKGQVNIEFHVEKDTNYIVFHSKKLTITDKLLQDKKGHHIKIVNLLEYPPTEQMYLEVKEKFRKRENYTLSLRYTTLLSKEPHGFYLSSYYTANGGERFLATTHFEPTYARSAFPCFDEPQLKARFKISIFRDRFHIALCNMPVVNTEDTGFYMGTGLLRDVFQESMEMSTFLVAFVVCDYAFVSSKTENEVSVAVYAPRALLNQTHFAMDVATKTIDYFEDFFMVSYPLPKQDLIAIPDYTTGAMENWGLITYRGNGILYETVETTTADHQTIAIAVTHELAHQWFGNLVTIKWWNDLWVHEGLCTFLEYLAVDAIYPEWGSMEQFILDKTQNALQLDSLACSHPISTTVQNPADIQALFDAMSYSKGASILHMMEQFLTREIFRNGLRDFLNLYRYGNADTKELWNVLSQNSNLTIEVKTVMDTWTQQMGYPLIRISHSGTTVSVTQERFLLSAEWNETNRSEPKSSHGYKWYIPLTYYTNVDPEAEHIVWLNGTDAKFEVSQEMKWIKANIRQSGFYRVMYDHSLWIKIIDTLLENYTTFSSADRANLIDDVFALSRAGLVNASVPLRLSLYLTKEREYAPWKTAVEHLQTWSRYLTESAAYKLFIQYIRRLIQPVTEYVGWKDNGSHVMKLLRSNILSLAILCDVEGTVKEARTRFSKWMQGGHVISPNLREIIYSAGIKYGGLHEWQHCWKAYNESKTTKERLSLMNALGATADPWLLQRYLLTTLNREMINVQDVKVVMSSVAANPKGQLLAWRHLKAYWHDIQELFGNGTMALGGLISTVTSHLSTPYDYKEVESYFQKTNIGPSRRALNQSLEKIRLNIQWITHNENDISNWLKDNPI